MRVITPNYTYLPNSDGSLARFERRVSETGKVVHHLRLQIRLCHDDASLEINPRSQDFVLNCDVSRFRTIFRARGAMGVGSSMLGQLEQAVNCGELVEEIEATCDSTCCFNTQQQYPRVLLTERGAMV